MADRELDILGGSLFGTHGLTGSALREVWDQVPLGVVVVNDSGRVLYTNATGGHYLARLGEHGAAEHGRGRRSSSQARTLAQLSHELASGAFNVGGVVDLVAETLSARDGEACVVSLMDQEGSLSVAAARHPDLELAAFLRGIDAGGPTPLGAGVAGRAAATEQPLLLSDLSGRELLHYLQPEHRRLLALPPRALRHLAGSRVQLIVTPIVHRSETLGTITLARIGGTRYLPRDVDWLGEVAGLTGLALANARLHDEAASRLVVLEASRRVDLAMAASVDQLLTLDVILDQLLVHMGVAAAAVVVPRADRDRLEVVASAGLRGAMARPFVEPGESRYAAALESGRAQVIEAGEVESWARSTGLVPAGFESAELIPLLARGEPVGILELLWRGPRLDDPEQRLGIDSMAVRAGIVVEKWRDGRQRGSRALAAAITGAGHAEQLSRAQLAVLRLLSEGSSNREIASQLHISENTVKSHLREIFRKLGARTRLQAAMMGTTLKSL